MQAVLRLSLVAVLAFAALFWVGAATAIASEVPLIRAHSDTDFAVYRGDHVLLEVQAKGEELQATWVRPGTTICHGLTCDIDTGELGLGEHLLTFIVFNHKGSLSLKYHIKVLAAPPGYKPGKVHPPLVEVKEGIESVAAADLTVRSVSGRGYSYHQRKLQVVGPRPRGLDWAETLRTQPGSLLRFGRDHVEDHLLPESSEVLLAKSDSGRRMIALVKGAVRSRALGPVDPRWSIVVGDWLQVDADSRGDVLVSADAAEAGDDDDDGEAEGENKGGIHVVRVTVLRGRARLFLRRVDQSAGSDGGVTMELPQGVELRLTRGDREFRAPTLPDATRVGPLVEQTTPQYGLGKDPLAILGETVMGDQRAADAAHALKLATEALQNRDYIVAIEAMAPFFEEAKGSYKACLLLGQAYAGLYLEKPARLYLEAAASLQDEAPDPHRYLGLLDMTLRSWSEAALEFQAADAAGDAHHQVVAYELGVALLNAGERGPAQAAFTRSLWTPDNEALAASARAFLKEEQQASSLDLRFGGKLLYDTNVLHSSVDPSTVGTGLSSNRGAAYAANAGASIWPVRTDGSTAELAFDAAERQYLNKTMKPLNRVDEALTLRLGLGGDGGPADRSAVRFDGGAAIGTIGLGGARALDNLNATAGLSSPLLKSLRLGVSSLLGVDPEPAHDYLIDPLRSEPVPPGDHSVHATYEMLSVRPVYAEKTRLDLGLRLGDVRYRSDYHTAENFHDLGLNVAGAYDLSLRSTLKASLDALKRSFPNADDGRKDTTEAVNLGWVYLWTSALSQSVEAEVDAQKSTSAVYTYKRQVYSYGLDLKL